MNPLRSSWVWMALTLATLLVVSRPLPGAEVEGKIKQVEVSQGYFVLTDAENREYTFQMVYRSRVVVDDRPVAMGSLQKSGGGITPAGLVMAWRPGTEGGAGVADVLYGAANPSGRLPVSWPKLNTDNPNSYLLLTQPSTSNNGSPTYQPLFPFGAGLSYTNYSFGTVSAARHGGSVNVRVAVSNTGGEAGDLVVPVYVSQPVSDPIVPAKRLVGFTRVHLAAGQSSTVTVTVPLSKLAITQGDVDSTAPPSVEHGQYVFSSGALSSAMPTNAAASLNL